MTQLPGGCLWVGEVKVSQQAMIIQVPEPTCIISHGVDGSRYVVVACDITVVALVQGI